MAAAPVQLTTPPVVYAFGTYWRMVFLGIDNDRIAAAKKKAIYNVVLANINLTAGILGLKLGTIPECPGDGMLGIGMTGGCD